MNIVKEKKNVCVCFRVYTGRRRVGGFGESSHVAQADRAIEGEPEVDHQRKGDAVQGSRAKRQKRKRQEPVRREHHRHHDDVQRQRREWREHLEGVGGRANGTWCDNVIHVFITSVNNDSSSGRRRYRATTSAGRRGPHFFA